MCLSGVVMRGTVIQRNVWVVMKINRERFIGFKNGLYAGLLLCCVFVYWAWQQSLALSYIEEDANYYWIIIPMPLLPFAGIIVFFLIIFLVDKTLHDEADEKKIIAE